MKKKQLSEMTAPEAEAFVNNELKLNKTKKHLSSEEKGLLQVIKRTYKLEKDYEKSKAKEKK